MCRMSVDLAAELRSVPVLSDLKQDELDWLAQHAEIVVAEPRQVVVREGDPADAMLIFLEGEMDGRRESLGPDSPVYSIRPGMITGLLPFSRMTHYTITGRVVARARVARISKGLFPEMLNRIPALGPRLVGVLSDRVREVTKQDQAREKLASLGKLSAGLAHELNNPAAAGKRAAAGLRETFTALERANAGLDEQNLGAEARALLRSIEDLTRKVQAQTRPRSPLELSDREGQLRAWLENNGITDGWQLAPNLAEADVKVDDLVQLTKLLPPSALGPAIARVAASLEIQRLLADVEHSTGRIAELVGAIKEYSFMDEAPRQEVDVARGIESTLVMLSHKLKRGITVIRDYDANLPRIPSYGSELNQVWTNLIDNAADAMRGQGELRIRTATEGDEVLVEFVDNGPGIPAEIQTRIFDPFFTTKPMGEGTGLGLDTVSRIVRKHRGNVSFVSQPGKTCFRVRLPVKNTRM
ncbi:MAG TPA: ATP-binding protein [Terriglobales bacterium]|nr:ATP-binding protein [Terriglobales bacterium]